MCQGGTDRYKTVPVLFTSVTQWVSRKQPNALSKEKWSDCTCQFVSLIPIPPFTLTKWPWKGWSGIFGQISWLSTSQIILANQITGLVMCVTKLRASIVGADIECHPRLQQVKQVRKHQKTQTVPCSSWKRYKNIFPTYSIVNTLVEYILRFRTRFQSWNIP